MAFSYLIIFSALSTFGRLLPLMLTSPATRFTGDNDKNSKKD
jgi:hypothetical protein